MTRSSKKYVPPARDGLECVAYMDDVLSGKVVACEKIRRICEMIRPRIEAGYKCWHYDPDKAKRPVEFIERFCCQPEGRIGVHLVLEPFQLFVLEVAFGFVDDNGLRQFRELFWVVARKNGKTSLSAALALYMLMKDGEYAPQCYSAATSKDQASLLYGSMMRMKNQSPMVSKRLRKGTVVSRDCDGLMYDANDGYFTPLSSQTKSLDGLNVHFAAIDEVAAITDRDVYDLIKQATPSRDQPFIVEITTNGFVRDNFFDHQYEYASDVLSGKSTDDTLLPVIYELDDRSEWTDESKWVKANPGLGTIKKVEALRGYVNKAKQDPSFLPTVLTKDFNLPENKASSWLRFEEAVNRETFDWREMGFRYCIVGYDASDSIDLTSAQALMMRPGDDHIYEMSMYWIPEEALDRRVRDGKRRERDGVPYEKWIADGLVRKVPGNKIDHRVIFDWMNELRDEYDVWPFALGYDPWHLTDDSWQTMAESFVGKKRLEPIRWGAKTLSVPMKQIRADYAAHRIVDNDNPVNQWNRMNVAVTIDRNDNYLPCKGNGSSGRIDGFAAELCAYIALQRHKDEYEGSI